MPPLADVQGLLAGFQSAQAAAAGLLENLLSSNYPLQKDRAPVDIQPAPSNLRLKHGKVSGSITVAGAPNSRRVIYEWQSAVGQIMVV